MVLFGEPQGSLSSLFPPGHSVWWKEGLNYTLPLWSATENKFAVWRRVVSRAKAASAGLRSRRQKKLHLVLRRTALEGQDHGRLKREQAQVWQQGSKELCSPQVWRGTCVDQIYATVPNNELTKSSRFRPSSNQVSLLDPFLFTVWPTGNWVNLESSSPYSLNVMLQDWTR